MKINIQQQQQRLSPKIYKINLSIIGYTIKCLKWIEDMLIEGFEFFFFFSNFVELFALSAKF